MIFSDLPLNSSRHTQRLSEKSNKYVLQVANRDLIDSNNKLTKHTVMEIGNSGNTYGYASIFPGDILVCTIYICITGLKSESLGNERQNKWHCLDSDFASWIDRRDEWDSN